MNLQLQQVTAAIPGGRFAAGDAPRVFQAHNGAARAARKGSDVDGFVGRLDPVVAASFTAEQKRALSSLLATRGATRHMVDLRQTVSFFGKRYYLAFFFGRERRLGELRGRLGPKEWVLRYLAYLGLALFLLAPCFGLAYLIRG